MKTFLYFLKSTIVLGLSVLFLALFYSVANAQSVQWYSADTPFNELVNWSTADSACTGLGTGWRLPTLGELTTKYSEDHSEFFLASDPTYGKYWTSTFDITYPDRAYYVDMYNGSSYLTASSSASIASHCIRDSVAPDAPIIGNAVPGDASATVSFSAPLDNGGSSILYYTVTSSSTDVTVTATSTVSPITVSGLTNGVEYTFTVTATNAIGESASSTDSNSITPLALITGTPGIAAGTPPTFDTQLTADSGDLSPSTNLTYTWYRSADGSVGDDVYLSTGISYTPVEADIGNYLVISVTSTDSTGTSSMVMGVAVAKAAGPSAPDAPVLESETDTSITLIANSLNEFNVDGGAWQDSPVFSSLNASTTYTFTTRVKETATSSASATSTGTEITTYTQLYMYQLTASSTLDSIYAGYTEGDYSGSNWITLTGYYTTGISDINAASDIAGVDLATSTAISGMASILTIDQEDAVAVASVASAIDFASSTAYTDIQVSSSTDQTELTTAVQTIIDSIASSTDITVSATVTFDSPNYSVAISKNATSSTYLITNATFSTSVADQAAADSIIAIINTIPGILTIESLGTVYAARAAYNSLNTVQQALVTNYTSGLLVAEAQIPSLFTAMLGTVHTGLESMGILNNIDTCGGASSTACSGLFFEKSGLGKITFPGALDLTSTTTVATLQGLDSGISFANGEIKFDANAGDAFKTLGGELEMYNLSFSETPSIYVDDVAADIGIDVADISYSSSTGTLTFTANHFSTFTVKDTAKAITSFSFVGLGTGEINEEGHLITVTVPYGTDASDLIATFITTGEQVTVTPTELPVVQVSGITSNNFLGEVTYTVTAEDGSTQNYIVSVSVALNPAKAIIAFSIPSQIGTTTINEIGHTITVVMPNGTDVSSLTPTVTITGLSVDPFSGMSYDFSSLVTYTVTADDSSTQDYTVNVLVVEESQTIPDESGDATISTTTPEVLVTNPTSTTTLSINSDVTNPTINVRSLVTNGSTTTTGTLPAINISSANANNTTVAIPASTVVTAASSTWNGIIAAPITTTVTLPITSGVTKTFSTAIELGLSGVGLSFDKAVRILLPGQAGKLAGYTRDGGTTFTEITNTCSADTQVAGDALSADSECKIDSGSDLVIWTKHFTTFATYSQTTNTTSARRPAVSSGGTVSTPTTVSTTTATTTATTTLVALATTTISVTPVSVTSVIVSGKNVSQYNFTKDLTFGATGADVTALQQTLVSEGYLTMPAGVAYGYFGKLTQTALIKYQKAKGISPAAGYFGPITRKAINSAVETTTQAQNVGTISNVASMTLKELVQLLLQIGAIASDKVDAANKLINSL